jgi:hypothetical protein
MRASRMNVASKLSQVDSLVDYSGRLAEWGSPANQNLIFSPNWNCRDVFDWAVT